MYLTDEQKIIIQKLRTNKKNFEIAEELGYSLASLKRRLKEIYSLYYVSSRLELIQKLFHAEIQLKTTYN